MNFQGRESGQRADLLTLLGTHSINRVFMSQFKKAELHFVGFISFCSMTLCGVRVGDKGLHWNRKVFKVPLKSEIALMTIL